MTVVDFLKETPAFRQEGEVSILVLVDDGRRRVIRTGLTLKEAVSILVLVDDGRRQRVIHDPGFVLPRSFNPCSCG